MNKEAHEITHISVNAQVLNFRLNNGLAKGLFSQALKQLVKNLCAQLIKIESKYFDKFLNESEESTFVVYETYDNFMKTVANVPIWDMENITKIIEAYQKDQKSIEGITKKILR